MFLYAFLTTKWDTACFDCVLSYRRLLVIKQICHYIAIRSIVEKKVNEPFSNEEGHEFYPPRGHQLYGPSDIHKRTDL
jgi:hypothetical protein